MKKIILEYSDLKDNVKVYYEFNNKKHFIVNKRYSDMQELMERLVIIDYKINKRKTKKIFKRWIRMGEKIK